MGSSRILVAAEGGLHAEFSAVEGDSNAGFQGELVTHEEHWNSRMSQPNLSSIIWSVAVLLRGDYKQSDYYKVILPFTVLRRLEGTKAAVLKETESHEKAALNPEPFLLKKAKQQLYKSSPLDMKTLLGDQDHIKENLSEYVLAILRSRQVSVKRTAHRSSFLVLLHYRERSNDW